MKQLAAISDSFAGPVVESHSSMTDPSAGIQQQLQALTNSIRSGSGAHFHISNLASANKRNTSGSMGFLAMVNTGSEPTIERGITTSTNNDATDNSNNGILVETTMPADAEPILQAAGTDN
eukprot:846605-Rhodomonas_salina.1